MWENFIPFNRSIVRYFVSLTINFMTNHLKNIFNQVQGIFDVLDDDDAKLVQEVKKGNRSAFDQLVIKHTDLAYGLAYRMTQKSDLAEDIVQDCFIKVWQQATDWNPKKAKFSTWLYRVVCNRCIDEMRSAAHRYNEPMEEDYQLASTQQTGFDYQAQQQQQQFQHAMQQLKLEQRTAIALVYTSGLSNKDAAAVMGVKLKAFESQLLRAKKALKEGITQQINAQTSR